MKMKHLIFCLLLFVSVNIFSDMPEVCEGVPVYPDITQKYYELRAWYPGEGCVDNCWIQWLKFMPNGENNYNVRCYYSLDDGLYLFTNWGTAQRLQMPDGSYLLELTHTGTCYFDLTHWHYSNRFYCGTGTLWNDSVFSEMEQLYFHDGQWCHARAGQYYPIDHTCLKFWCNRGGI